MRPLPDVSNKYGAPMGRQDSINDPEAAVEFEIQRLRMVDGDYDEGGAYWGSAEGEHIYRAEGESGEFVEAIFVRARDLTEAKATIRETYPNASFASSCDLEAFLSAYVEAALWSSSNDRYEDDPDNEAEMLDEAGYDLAPEAEAQMHKDCSDFLDAHGDLVAKAAEARGYAIERAGHDFWLTRCGHGAGFWDRGLGKVGDELSEAAKVFGNVDLYIGDDDLVHASNEERPSAAPRP